MCQQTVAEDKARNKNLEEYVGNVFGLHDARLEHGESRLHKEHQGAWPRREVSGEDGQKRERSKARTADDEPSGVHIAAQASHLSLQRRDLSDQRCDVALQAGHGRCHICQDPRVWTGIGGVPVHKRSQGTYLVCLLGRDLKG